MDSWNHHRNARTQEALAGLSGLAAAGFEDVEEEDESGEDGPGEGAEIEVDEDSLSGCWRTHDWKTDERDDDI